MYTHLIELYYVTTYSCLCIGLKALSYIGVIVKIYSFPVTSENSCSSADHTSVYLLVYCKH
jgi:hypothetical protein